MVLNNPCWELSDDCRTLSQGSSRPRLALDGQRERIARRLHDAEAVLAALAATPRPLPGSEEDWAMATSARQAEGDADRARADLNLLDARLGTEIAWDDVRKRLARVADIALRDYARYLRDAYLAEARTTLRHAADRVLETRAVYQRTIDELSALARGHVPPQPDLIAPRLVEALQVLLQADGWMPSEPRCDSVDRSPRGLSGLVSQVFARAAGRRG